MAQKVKLLSSDTQQFEVDEEVAFLSQTVKNLVEDAGMEDAIPLPNVSGRILAKVIEYSKYHVEAEKKGADDKPSKSDDDIKTWDNEFVKVDQATLFDLILVGSEAGFAVAATEEFGTHAHYAHLTHMRWLLCAGRQLPEH